jgi:excisionase family DNA binding protein
MIAVHVNYFMHVWEGLTMNEDRPLPEVLTVAEVANYLRVSETTVWRWCSDGRLPAFRIGRGWRVQRGDLEQHIKAQKYQKVDEHLNSNL